ncbi:MAG TPA: hypothetical protein HPP77_00010 [Candidatus Hydrogenedentes bacterium]|nr:hypothetical protein [Candidatus Hydrogenedentota bacterium]
MFQDYKVAYLRKHVNVREARPMSFLRQSVAHILSESARTVPHASMITQFDVTPLVEYTKASREAMKAVGQVDDKTLFRLAIRKNYSAFFVKTFAHALENVPAANGFFDYAPIRNGGTFYETEDINIAVTVHTPLGVIAPIVRNPHKKTLETVAQEVRTVARKARRTDPETLYRKCANAYVSSALRQLDWRALPGVWMWLRSALFPRRKHEPLFTDVPDDQKLQPEDILCATCTIANIGMMLPGIQSVTVVVPPEVLFFGIGDLHLGPWVVDGQVVPRYLISVNATMDHRPFDAGEAFPLHQHIRRYIDKPALIYEWKEGDKI